MATSDKQNFEWIWTEIQIKSESFVKFRRSRKVRVTVRRVPLFNELVENNNEEEDWDSDSLEQWEREVEEFLGVEEGIQAKILNVEYDKQSFAELCSGYLAEIALEHPDFKNDLFDFELYKTDLEGMDGSFQVSIQIHPPIPADVISNRTNS